MIKSLRLFTFISALLCCIYASAYDYLTEGVNKYEAYSSLNGIFNTTKAGTVKIEAHQVMRVTYSGKEYEYEFVPGNPNGNYVYEVEGVSANDNVFIKIDFAMSTSTLTISIIAEGEKSPIDLIGVTPNADTTFSWDRSGQVTLSFNKYVSFSSIELVAGEKKYSVNDIHAGSNVSCNITEALNAAITDGLQPGDIFSIDIKGLCAENDSENLYKGDGELSVKFKSPHRQYALTSATVNGAPLNADYTFLSYYNPAEKDGVLTFTFEETVKSVNDVYITMGNVDLSAQGMYHRSSVPFKIDGNKLIVDLRGDLRTLRMMFPGMNESSDEDGAGSIAGDFDTKYITLTLSNVIDMNGNPFLSTGAGTIGSYSYMMRYEELREEAFIDGDGIAEGDEVHSNQEITLWFSNSNIDFDGLKVTYFTTETNPNDEGEAIMVPKTVVVGNYKKANDIEGILITFNLPEFVDAASASLVTVALNNAKSSDGMPHDYFITFKTETKEPVIVEKGWQFAAVTPAEGKVTSLKQIHFTYPESVKWINENVRLIIRSSYGASAEVMTADNLMGSADGNILDVVFKQAGTYTLEIPANTFTSNSGEGNLAQTFTWTIEGNGKNEGTPTGGTTLPGDNDTKEASVEILSPANGSQLPSFVHGQELVHIKTNTVYTEIHVTLLNDELPNECLVIYHNGPIVGSYGGGSGETPVYANKIDISDDYVIKASVAEGTFNLYNGESYTLRVECFINPWDMKPSATTEVKLTGNGEVRSQMSPYHLTSITPDNDGTINILDKSKNLTIEFDGPVASAIIYSPQGMDGTSKFTPTPKEGTNNTVWTIPYTAFGELWENDIEILRIELNIVAKDEEGRILKLEGDADRSDHAKVVFYTLSRSVVDEPDEPKEPEETDPVTPEEPENPDTPDNPDNPETPDNPDTPENPDNPDTPDNPDNPENPENPENPDNPETPENPENPEEPEEPDTPNIPSTVKTPNTSAPKVIHTVSGVKVLNAKGIVIINGKKYLIKK